MKIPWPPSFFGLRYFTHKKCFCLLIATILFIPSAKFESNLNTHPVGETFSPVLIDSEQCPEMLPKYFADVQFLGGSDENKVVYVKKSSETKEQCIQLCCVSQKNCSAVFMLTENSKLTCFHVSKIGLPLFPRNFSF